MAEMRILLVGSGAREHALAWKIRQSPLVTELYCAPGNAGTAALGVNVPLEAGDVDSLVSFALEKEIDLVVAGPELPLSRGLSDALAAKAAEGKPRCFGPSMAASRIESSKVFSKHFMKKFGIPTAEFRIFDAYDEAIAFVRNAPWPFVIKADGLASGKGVFLPSSLVEAEGILSQLLREKKLGDAGREVVIEKRLEGEEVSILGFCDGRTVKVMPPSQDHKRLLENDKGPNTGGMGALASADPVRMAMAGELARNFLEKACEGMSKEGTPFSGVLYAGIILTKDGPKALEYNCRFGDPEAEVIIPLLESDIVGIFLSCAEGSLDKADLRWADKASACVVIADEGYAGEGVARQARAMSDFGGPRETMLFHASTRLAEGGIVVEGGRLLCASAWAETLDLALDRVYSRVARVSLPGSRYRRDIGVGRNYLRTSVPLASSAALYASAGVDIDAGDRAVELMKEAVRSTYGAEVLAGIGSFGGIYSAAPLTRMAEPVLVASTDGVGTKVKLAALAGKYWGIGRDIVNHCIDDILVQGARPLFFLDYVATSRLDPAMVAEAVGGMASACREAGCALIGGETAEMPGVYLPGEFDLAGAIVGAAERGELLPRADLREGDVLVGLPSSGLHTNGFSLARKIFADTDMKGQEALLGRPLIDALLEPHHSYLPEIGPVLSRAPGLIKALAHITGGGFEGNVPRVLPSWLEAHIEVASWEMPPLFSLIMEKGKVPAREMYRVFNMGIGMIAIIDPSDFGEFSALSGGRGIRIGYLARGEAGAVLTRDGVAL